MLTLLHNGSSQGTSGLNVAASHLQHAMTHLNSAARRVAPSGDAVELEELRLIVYALNDLLIELTALNRRLPATDETAAAAPQKCGSPVSIRNGAAGLTGTRAIGSA